MDSIQNAKKQLRDSVVKINNDQLASLSDKKIYSDIKKILSKPEDQVHGLYVNYIKKLAGDIYKNAAHKRLLSQLSDTWNEAYNKEFGQYTLSDATKQARALVEMCRKMTKAKNANSVELKPEHFDDILAWQKAEMEKRTEYSQFQNTIGDWTLATVDESLNDSETKLGVNQLDPTQKFTYDETLTDDKNAVVDAVYCKLRAFREEWDKHGLLWRWFSKKADVCKNYISRANQILKAVGFDEKKHGDMVIENAKKTVMFPFDKDYDIAIVDYKNNISQYNKNHVPEINVARKHFEWANELNLDPELSFFGQIKDIAEKYNISPEELGKSGIDWGTAARKYDFTRDTTTFKEGIERVFLNSYRRLMEKALEKDGANVKMSQVLSDARKIAIIATQFHSPAFSTDEFKSYDKIPYLTNLNSDFFKTKTEQFIDAYNKKLGDNAPNAITAEQKKAVAADAEGVINNWVAAPQKVNDWDVKYARTHAGPDQTEFSPVSQKIVNSLLTIEYKPPEKENTKLLQLHQKVLGNIQKKWLGKDSKLSEEAKSVLNHNAYRLSTMCKLAFENYGNADIVNDNIASDELEVKEKFPNYKPVTFDDLENDELMRFSIPIEMEDETNSSIEPKKQEPPQSKNELVIE